MHRAPTAAAIALALTLLANLTASCDATIPRDTYGTLDHIEARGALRVGVSERPPLVELDSEHGAIGLEAELVRLLADDLGVEVRWHPLPHDELLEALEQRTIDLAVGGFAESSPDTKGVGVSLPYAELHGELFVVLVPPGEHRWLLPVDRVVHGASTALHRAASALETRKAAR